jgi:hypothetical protein
MRPSIEDPLVIRKILAHLDEKAASVATGRIRPRLNNGEILGKGF